MRKVTWRSDDDFVDHAHKCSMSMIIIVSSLFQATEYAF